MATISVTNITDGSTIDAADVNNQINTIVNEVNGNLDNANIKSGAAISGSKIADASIDLGAKASTWDGWVPISDSWTYASATTITVPSDATTKYSVGDKIKLVQTTTKYFYIVGVASTTLTITGGSDYTLTNAAISGVYYSKAATPLGFPGSFAYAPVFTGFSADPSGVHQFAMHGKWVTLTIRHSSAGTSNATTFTITLPVTAKTLTNQVWTAPALVTDSGSAQTAPGSVLILSAGTTASIFKLYGSGSFTNSGNKSCNSAVVIYEAA